MIRDGDVFEDDYRTQILHRDSELGALSRLLEPAVNGTRAEDVLVYGPSGVGKTSTVRWLLRDLFQRASVTTTGIECSGLTAHQIIHKVAAGHPKSGIVHNNQSREALLDTLDEIADEPYIVILDEGDIVPDLDVLEDLLSVEQVSVIAITHQHIQWLDRLNAAIEPYFPADSRIEFRKYHVPELMDILKPRIEHGLVGDPTREGQLEWIADTTNGEARWAIKSVLAAAELAVKRGHDEIHRRDVADSFDRAKRKIREDNLESLPVTYQRLYELVRLRGPVDGETMKATYNTHKDRVFEGRSRVVKWRQAWNYLSKMADYDLIEMPGETNSKVYQVVDEELEAPVEFELGEVPRAD
ncbi:Cdc6/Cdc18 family protein [Natrialba sp. SSL1]|uniref:Cdc6/Cdc18 family protein n=1 Tax=Natrialba sp. SSL1 TaxID=1869245 RepID=UPI0008F86530|nr:AAA family ATPase [Natrialba sp. SSL1]OIB59375.1 AAA family ATPase [Natrialba sp. SSL1]